MVASRVAHSVVPMVLEPKVRSSRLLPLIILRLYRNGALDNASETRRSRDDRKYARTAAPTFFSAAGQEDDVEDRVTAAAAR